MRPFVLWYLRRQQRRYLRTCGRGCRKCSQSHGETRRRFMEIRLAQAQDIDGWMALIEQLRAVFPGSRPLRPWRNTGLPSCILSRIPPPSVRCRRAASRGRCSFRAAGRAVFSRGGSRFPPAGNRAGAVLLPAVPDGRGAGHLPHHLSGGRPERAGRAGLLPASGLFCGQDGLRVRPSRAGVYPAAGRQIGGAFSASCGGPLAAGPTNRPDAERRRGARGFAPILLRCATLFSALSAEIGTKGRGCRSLVRKTPLSLNQQLRKQSTQRRLSQ